ncbi:unknown [Clostridium sp. CAG:964]|nr:unknown [Clostridium sp. CAG:964]
MPDDDGYVYQEFFSDENLDEFKNKNVGCFTMLIIIIILIMLLVLLTLNIALTYFAITSPETYFKEDGTKKLFLLIFPYVLVISIVVFIIYQYHKNKKK